MWASEWKWRDLWEICRPGVVVGVILGALALAGIILFIKHTEGEARRMDASLNIELRMARAERLRDLQAEADSLKLSLAARSASDEERGRSDEEKQLAEVMKEYARIRLEEKKNGNSFCSDLPLTLSRECTSSDN